MGRKRHRTRFVLAERVLLGQYSLTQEARRLSIAQSVASKRLASALRALVTRPTELPPRGPCALVVDGVYFRFARREWVLYLMALKPARGKRMYFLDPVLIEGRERLEAWYQAIGTIPPQAKERIRALVSDGLRGFQQLAVSHGWTHQRCHFHLLSALVRGKGKRRYAARGSAARDAILRAVRIMLADNPTQKRESARRALRRHVDDPLCPSYVRKHVVEFLEREPDFRAYLHHPKLDLPPTTNAVESTGRLVRKATRTARTPRSVLLRATALLRLKKSVVCNGNLQPT
jgi:transposase-like protein